MDILEQLVASGKLNISCHDIESIYDDHKTIASDEYLSVIKLILSSNSAKYRSCRIQLKNLAAVITNLNTVNSEITQMIIIQIKCIFNKFLTKTHVKSYDVENIHKILQFLDNNNMNDVLEEIIKKIYTLIKNNKEVSKSITSIIVHLPNSLGEKILNKLFTKFNISKIDNSELVFNLISEILYELEQIKHKQDYFYKYDTIIEPIVNSDYVSADMLLSLMKNLYSNNHKNNTNMLADRIYLLCDEDKKIKIASLIPNFYIRESLINDNNNYSDDNDYKVKYHNNIDYLKYLMHNIAPYMQSDIIRSIILAVHGCYDITKLLFKRTFHHKSTYRYEHEIRSHVNGANIISYKLFCIDAINIINLHFPKQLKNMIHEGMFEHILCVYRNRYESNITKELVKYIRILNAWEYLPYELICDPYMEKTEKIECCPICLNDTNWQRTKCKHVICKKCYVDTVYDTNQSYRRTKQEFLSCMTCKTLKRLQNNIDADANEDEVE